MKKIVLLIIAGALVLGLGILILVEQPGIQKTLDTAAYIDDGKIKSENEGKVVILAGTVEPELPFKDPLTDVSIPYFAAYRKAEMFIHIKNTDYEYDWFALIWDTESDNKGVNTEELSSSKLIAPIKIGEYNIDPRIFKEIETIDKWKDITEDDLGDYKLYIHKSKNDDTTYLSEDEYIPDQLTEYKGNKWHDHEDKMRYSYEVYDDKDPLDFTVVGIQQGDWLMLDDDLDISYIKKGIHSGEDFIGDNLNTNRYMGIGISGAGAAILGLAVYFMVKRKR